MEQSGIVAVLADRQAIAVGINRRRAGTWVNPIDQYTNISESFVTQYINDLSENGIIMIVAEESSDNSGDATTEVTPDINTRTVKKAASK